MQLVRVKAKYLTVSANETHTEASLSQNPELFFHRETEREAHLTSVSCQHLKIRLVSRARNVVMPAKFPLIT